MAFLVQSQTPSVEVFPSSPPVDVVEVGFTSLPSGTFAVATIPALAWAAEGQDVWIGPLSDGIESTLTMAGVIGAVYEQDISASGLLVDYLVFTVSINPPNASQLGPMTAQVRVPLFAFGEAALRGPLIVQPIEQAQNALAYWASKT